MSNESKEKNLRKKLENLIADYRYKAMDLGRDLPTSERDYAIRCSLEKTVMDLEELLK
jgi:hypothetical protein